MAKLVEILAKAFSHWPDGAKSVIYGDFGSAAYFDMGAGYRDCMHLDDRDQDQVGAGVHIVTHAEWQEARDALMSKKSGAETFANDYVDANKSRYTKEWSGEGLPPVGTVCEHKHLHDWKKVEVFAVKPNYNGSQTALFTYESGCWGGCAEPSLFRPIRTPEQIEAEDRKRVEEEIQRICVDGENNGVPFFKALFEAGYRKQEQK